MCTEGLVRYEESRSGIEFSPFSRAAGERGRGRGGLADTSSMPVAEAQYLGNPLPKRDRILPSPMQFMEERPGMGGAAGRQFDPCRRHPPISHSGLRSSRP
jgi:hypothetical protein